MANTHRIFEPTAGGDHREANWHASCSCGWSASGSGKPGADDPTEFALAMAADLADDHLAADCPDDGFDAEAESEQRVAQHDRSDDFLSSRTPECMQLGYGEDESAPEPSR